MNLPQDLTIEQVLNIAREHHAAGQLPDAERIYLRILQVDPQQAEALHLLGVIAHQLGGDDQAVALISQAVALRPNFPEARVNLANALWKLSRLPEALEQAKVAAKGMPKSLEAQTTLGNLLAETGQFQSAVAAYRKAIAIQPRYAEAHSNLGNALIQLKRYKEAIRQCQKAITIQPDFAEAHNNLGIARMQMRQLDKALASYEHSLALGFSYSMVVNCVNTLLYLPGLEPEERYQRAAKHLQKLQPDGEMPPRPELTLLPGERLRVGYLSSDFRNHPVGHNMLPLLQAHDPRQVESFVYAELADGEDSISQTIKKHVDHWRPTYGVGDVQLAETIRQDRIHIMVYIAGFFDKNRIIIAMQRPAPIQVSMFSGASTTFDCIDYWLTDHRLHPEGEVKERFCETLWRLPTLFNYPIPEQMPDVGPLPMEKSDGVMFGSFNNPTKITAPVIRLWAQILTQLPDARLMLKFKTSYQSPELVQQMRAAFKRHGVHPKRLLMIGKEDTRWDHLNYYNRVDIALDPFPFSGATTTFQALWMGVPVVALMGDYFIGRMAGSFLGHLGLEELAAASEAHYLEIALKLAQDVKRLSALRMGMRQSVQASPLCDHHSYARAMEQAYKEMVFRRQGESL
ncbi:MAG: tetratricopeptide repeat protein [Magnetococcales bacterium]|nr:tetratricopeptide repeat protein [Magnetococcales bacterium]